MEQLEHPDELTWQERRDWFEDLRDSYAQSGIERPSEQALALMIDLQAVFCAGAWAASVILSAAVVDCQSRARGLKPPRDWLPGVSRRDLTWLHGLRNGLMHDARGEATLSIQDQWTKRPEWEAKARRAVDVAFAALYPPPCGPES